MEVDSASAGSSTAAPVKAAIDLYLITEEDAHFEAEILRDAYSSIKPWLRYIDHKLKTGSIQDQVFVYERAVKALPRSYKIWKQYLDLRVKHVTPLNPAKYAGEYEKVNDCFERSLILLNKMPRIWEDYLQFLMKQCVITKTRKTFDRALRALPVTQHQRIWDLYIPFANSASGETAVRIWRRYMQVHPEDAEEFIELLVAQGKYQEAAEKWIEVLDNPRFKSKEGKSHFQMWSELCDLLVTRAREIKGIDVEKIVRSGIAKFSDQRGKLWTSLGTYWITRRDFERARDAFEEGITTVMTVRDFTQIFDSYTEFEESIISQLMEEAQARQEKGVKDEEADEDLDIRMMRFEQLMDRRPFLVNDVLLRQNPNNVIEWEKRVGLWGGNKEQVVATYADAVAAVNPKKAVGSFASLWAGYAKFYEEHGDLRQARMIMEKAVKVPFKSVQELGDMWKAWGELELRHDNIPGAFKVMEKATAGPKKSNVDFFDETLTPQQRLHKYWGIWSWYLDLLEAQGTYEQTCAAYERVFELKIATPNTVVNYANYLWALDYFEDAFRIYERGLDLFSYPVAFEIWNLYLTKAIERKLNIERLRDLFEQAIDGCPPKFVKPLYLMYGALEEERGLARHAMRIYERATRAIPPEDCYDMYEFYITKAHEHWGPSHARPIYESAIEVLSDKDAKKMCIKFAELETKLGEIDRARAIYAHGSQFSDPRISPEFWKKWDEFEVQHGNEDTYKEMLRIKRSVQAQYNTDVNFIASQAVARSQAKGAASAADGDEKRDALEALEREARAPQGFVAASSGHIPGTVKAGESAAGGDNGASKSKPADANPDAIDLDMDD